MTDDSRIVYGNYMPVFKTRLDKNPSPAILVNRKPVQDLIEGKDLDSVIAITREHGYSTRILELDGKSFPCNYDYNLNRINLYIRDGVIYKTDIG